MMEKMKDDEEFGKDSFAVVPDIVSIFGSRDATDGTANLVVTAAV